MQQQPMPAPLPADLTSAEFATPLSATRLLVFGGIALIAVGMIFGDIFAVFVLHPNTDRIGEHLMAGVEAVSAGAPTRVSEQFASIGSLLENRGTKVDAHVHIIDFGYLALLMAVVQPYVALSEARRKLLAKLLLTGAVMLPVGVFCIHYVGVAYSPLQAIGWASIVADFGGLLVGIAVAGELWGLIRCIRGLRQFPQAVLVADRSWSARALLTGGTLLVLAGFLHGAWYAAFSLYEHEEREGRLLKAMLQNATDGKLAAASAAVNAYGALQGEKAVAMAAHSHIIEFGLLAILLAFVQPYVLLSETWRRRWVWVLLAGSVILPVFVQAEIRWGLLAGGIADLGGAMVVVALLAMLVGVLRYTGSLDRGASA
jgi:hypothetical protein